MDKKPSSKCVLCGKTIFGYGNNAQPLKEGRCCDSCNKDVINERVAQMYGSKK